ncbi:ABC transporter ATP-binding protein [Peptococcaceae bacterium]|nr:ABC transporter ATP-binding protein [Peptococcaceae bacterium]
MKTILQINNLSKKYGKKTALQNINLKIVADKIYGLLGPNSSGKTTLFKIIAGLLTDYSGEVLIQDSKPGLQTKAIVSYLPDKDYLYDWSEVKDAVGYFNDFYPDFDLEKIQQLLDFMELKSSDSIRSFSKGMKARLKMALVLSRKAKLFLLDEPFDGIDAVSRDKLIGTILKTFSGNSTIILITHHISYVENLLEDVVFLNKGTVVLEDNAENIRKERQLAINELYLKVFGNDYTT